MSERTQALLAVVTGVVLIAAAGASSAPSHARRAARDGVLFTDEARPGALESGLWLVAPTGRAARLLGRRWHPWARSKTGMIAASRSGTREGALWLLFRHRAVRVPRSAAVACVSWSSDGCLLSYVTGKPFVYAPLPGGA